MKEAERPWDRGGAFGAELKAAWHDLSLKGVAALALDACSLGCAQGSNCKGALDVSDNEIFVLGSGV